MHPQNARTIVTDEKMKVLVAMSGGVDSSLAACLLAAEGHDCIGVSMQVWDYRRDGGSASKATCCAPSDFCDARMVADRIGIPFYVFDFEEDFRREVIDPFVAAYEEGRTPNPCIACNRKVKFAALRARAASMGITHVATGHYARIEARPDGLHLLRGMDRNKDQSYFLYALTREELARTLFPLGGMSKDEVRTRARAAGLPTADKPESQDICFVSGSVRDFVERIGGSPQVPGQIVDAAGTVLGAHEGVSGFTVGQRRGIGVGGRGAPLYVTAIEADTNTVVVGERGDLERESFEVCDLNWVAPATFAGKEFEALVQVRSRHGGTRVRVSVREGNRAKVRFCDAWVPVAPGQAAVFYDLDNEEVLGGGTITGQADHGQG